MNARDAALGIVTRLQEAGHEAYWVGGCVRDPLVGIEPKDFDVATSALPDAVAKLFPRTRAVGRKFGVILVQMGRASFEVATFRTGSVYEDGRRPSRVEFANARADALRRDFTVNAMFFDPVRSELHDWVEGEADLRAGLIRTVGEPDVRFAEDHLRMLRAIRFAVQLGFAIEPGTFAAIQRQCVSIRAISAERVREELIRVFRPPRAAQGLDLLRESGLLAEVLPELMSTIGCEQTPDFHPEGSVYNHIRLMLSHLPERSHPDLPWAVLLHDIAKPRTAQRSPESGRITFHGHERIGEQMARTILAGLRFPRKRIDDIAAAVRYHMQFKDAPKMRRATLRRMLMRPMFDLELELHRLDCLGSHGALDIYELLVAQRAELEAKPALKPPLVTGDDLMELGYSPGKFLGEVLAEIREKQLQEELRTRGEAMDWARLRLAKSR